MLRKKKIPNMAVASASMMRYAPERLRLARMRSGISACGLRASMTTKPASSSADAVSDAMTRVSPQCETPD